MDSEMDVNEYSLDDILLLGIAGVAQHVVGTFRAAIVPTMAESDDEPDPERDDELAIRNVKRKAADVPRVANYVQIVHNFNCREFQAHFHVSRDAFQWLLGKIGQKLDYRSNGDRRVAGRPFVTAEKQLLAILWLLATPDSFRSVACRFGTSKSTLHQVFLRVVDALVWLGPQVCSWPNIQERKRIRQFFKDLSGLDGVVAIVDGTYVPIKPPNQSNNPSSYVNRKCFYGMTLQGMCDDKRRFLDAFSGYPSSVSDTRIFQESPIVEAIENQPDKYFSPHEFILGDQAYETKTYCVPPYKRGPNYTNWMSAFNKKHARCRQIIERTFALYFGRFRRFKYVDMTRTDLIPKTISAGIVLHNVCLMKDNDDLQAEFEADGVTFLRENALEYPPPPTKGRAATFSNQAGKLFRDQLALEMGLLNPEAETAVDELEEGEPVIT